MQDIHDPGGVLAAIDLAVDPTTDTGELLLTLMLALARMERRRLAAGAVRRARASHHGRLDQRVVLGLLLEHDPAHMGNHELARQLGATTRSPCSTAPGSRTGAMASPGRPGPRFVGTS